jgi:hypothetical protein
MRTTVFIIGPSFLFIYDRYIHSQTPYTGKINVFWDATPYSLIVTKDSEKSATTILYPEEGSSRFFRNVSNDLSDWKVLQPRKNSLQGHHRERLKSCKFRKFQNYMDRKINTEAHSCQLNHCSWLHEKGFTILFLQILHFCH